jgi:hypothetical protein
MKSAAVKIFAFCCLLVAANWQLACSIPKLESPQCSEAGDQVKEFYSWYLGTDAEMRGRQRDVYERFISPKFQTDVAAGTDPFFRSTTPPTTFKIGKCESISDSQGKIQVQLYWRFENKTDQKEVYADVVKSGDRWLIEKVESR